jgi:hypothetical protein
LPVVRGVGKSGTDSWPGDLICMKLTKAIRRQAETAERAALNATDEVAAAQMRNLARAFRTQAEIIKKNKKSKKK